MKVFIGSLVVIVGGAGALLVGMSHPGSIPSVNEPIISAAPSAPSAQSELPRARNSNSPQLSSPALPSLNPLPASLIVAQQVMVTATYGQITLPAGAPVTLVRDDGESAWVRWSTKTVLVPRYCLAAAGAQPRWEAPAPSPVVPVGAPARAPIPQPNKLSTSLSLEAHETGTGSATVDNFPTDYGSYDKEFSRHKTILASVRSMSGDTGKMDLTIYWVAKQTLKKNRYIHFKISFPVELHGLAQQEYLSTCPPLAATDTKLVMIGARYASGGTMDGWIAVLRREDHVIRTAASNPTLRDIVEKEASLAALITAPHPG
jgi:hypothetical protein